MKSVTQIGRLALTRLFNPGTKNSHGGKITTFTEVSFPKKEFDLSQTLRERSMDDVLHYPQKFFVWSIELGLFELDTETAGGSILNAIANVIKNPRRTASEEGNYVTKELIVPSHLIFFSSSTDGDIGHDIINDKYEIYRLSPQQELTILLLAKIL